MNASLEIRGQSVEILLHKALKYERMWHSQMILGQADGITVYVDANGRIRVVPKVGPHSDRQSKAAQAVRNILDGTRTLVSLAKGTSGR